MTTFNEIISGSTFIVPADADSVIYTLNADGTVNAENMVSMTAEEAREAFASAELRVTSSNA